MSFILSIMQKNKLFFCKTDQLHFRILWIVLRSSFGKTNFIKDSPLPNPFWKLQNWDCFNAGLVYCARAICQSMYQIAINMSRYKYKLSQFTHHITVLLMLWHFLRIKSPWNLLKLQSSKCKCNLKIDGTTRLEAKTFLATDSSPSYPFFEVLTFVTSFNFTKISNKNPSKCRICTPTFFEGHWQNK